MSRAVNETRRSIVASYPFELDRFQVEALFLPGLFLAVVADQIEQDHFHIIAETALLGAGGHR